jgi:REP element-mobilizing transposase RayT
MARLARIVVPDCPHHVTARGNQREPIFFENGDQDIYCDMLAEQMRKAEVEVWAYCLMPNHVHLVLCPRNEMLGACTWCRASQVGEFRQWPRPVARSPVRRQVRFRRHGRKSSELRNPLCRAQSGSRAARAPRP